MDRKAQRWLYGELPDLVRQGVLTEASADSLRHHYGPLPEGGRNLGVLICALLGALLIGLGLILLLAHNWDELGRPMRALLSVLPLVIGQALCVYTLSRQAESMPWREASGTFLTLAVGASIALISQTYHIPGDFGHFMLAWTLLSLPLVYLLPATFPAVLCGIGFVVWAGWVQDHGGSPYWVWLGLSSLVPYLGMQLHGRPRQWPAVLLLWTLMPCLFVAIGICLNDNRSDLWVLIYGCLLAAFPVLDGLVLPAADSRWRMPLTFYGWTGVLLLCLLLTVDGGSLLRHANLLAGDAGPWAMLLVAGVLWLWVMVALIRAQAWDLLPIAAAGALLLVIVLFQDILTAGVGFWLVNLYLLWLALSQIRRGIVQTLLTPLNGGLLIFAILVTLRFFDSDLSFTLRGVLFIMLGLMFIGANVWARQRRRG